MIEKKEMKSTVIFFCLLKRYGREPNNENISLWSMTKKPMIEKLSFLLCDVSAKATMFLDFEKIVTI